MTQTRRNRQHSNERNLRGFTLVEMLVSVALVLLIMSIFASAFQIATGTLLKQRGAAENNQRVRATVVMLKSDLGKRTYQQRDDLRTQPIYVDRVTIQNDPNGLDLPDERAVFEMKLANTSNALGRGIVPLHPDYYIPGIGGKGRGVDEDNERGYFYISENDPFNDADDVLQFTADATITEFGSEDTTPFTGRATALGPTWDDTNSPPDPGFPINQDQPIWDDGLGYALDDNGVARPLGVGAIGTSKSRYAEISYFVRNGNLYRRVLLIRDPSLARPPGPVGDEAQPTFDDGTEIIPGDYPATSNFWSDFDFSATRQDDISSFMRFNVLDDLDNSSVPHGRTALGNPRNRFGHDPFPAVLQGRPKEYRSPSDITTFIGRYTHEETSHPSFQFPGQSGFNRMRPGDPTIFTDGPREGEDLLMTNVHAFDIKVWDDALREWVDLGHEVGGGDWHRNRVDGGGVPVGNQWTPFASNTFPFEQGDINDPTDNPSYVLPFQSARRRIDRYGNLTAGVGDDGQPGIAGFDDDGNGTTDDGTELGWPDSDDSFGNNRIFDTWHPQFDFVPLNNFSGEVVENALDDPPPFRPLWTERNGFDVQSGLVVGHQYAVPVVWEANHLYAFPTETDTVPGRVFPQPRERDVNQYYPSHLSMFYQVVGVSDLGLGAADEFFSGPNEPAWPAVAGEEVQDGEIRWRAFNNTIGLQAIQITVRFLDPTSQQMRQVTIIHPFVEL